MAGMRAFKRPRRFPRLAAWAGLAAILLHQVAAALGGAMPVAVAMAQASAAPGQIVICTANGPVTIDAPADFGGVPDPTHTQRTACDLSLHASAAHATEAAPAPLPLPQAAYGPAYPAQTPEGHVPAAARSGTSGPRAPPITS